MGLNEGSSKDAEGEPAMGGFLLSNLDSSELVVYVYSSMA